MLGIAVVVGIVAILAVYRASRVSTAVGANMRDAIYRRLQGLSAREMNRVRYPVPDHPHLVLAIIMCIGGIVMAVREGTTLSLLRQGHLAWQRADVSAVLAPVHDAYHPGRQPDEEIVGAAKAAYADDFIRNLPDGYATVLAGDASTISAGQKQLVTIARAFLANPGILILDEATSNVDSRTELMIQDAMACLHAGRTSFVIAHLLSTIRDAGTIVVMDAGRVVEQGSHEELLRRHGFYRDICNGQFPDALPVA
jgi:ABC-type lipopolysaccharide export system ATPase subunit